MYLIINCSSCGKIIMASTANKTRSCHHCGVKVSVQGAKVLVRSRTSQEAVEIIQHLKSQKNRDSPPVTFKKFKP
jgi:DNA-directed RNA polymerase subunit RPC12/RpoP